MPAHAVFLPACAMALLTLLVWLRMLAVRVGEMRRRRIHPQSVATSSQVAEKYLDTRASDNLRNLFELPVMFYAALGVAFAIGAGDPLTLGLAWAFVALRALHSLIQCGYNRVVHRFVAYVAGGAVLWTLWGRLVWQLLR